MHLRPSSFVLHPSSLLLVASLFPLWATLHNLSDRNDDAYITLTYAKSLAAGQGWRYNGGQEALGTTTPLFALLIAALARILPAVPLDYLAVGVGVLCWLAVAWFFYLSRRSFHLTTLEGALLSLVLLLQGWWWLASLGMEATLLIFGLVLAIWLAARGHAFAAGLVSASLFLVRPEGVAMVPLAGTWLLLHSPQERSKSLLRFAAGAALPLLLWTIYAMPRFGAILPNSARAKLGQGSGWPGAPFVERLLREWLPSYAAQYGSPLLSLLWPLAALGLVASARRVLPLILLA
ncbi:MAG: hypothetical protein ACRDIB_09230, partial [Ardenticatenaceae bacterium]